MSQFICITCRLFLFAAQPPAHYGTSRDKDVLHRSTQAAARSMCTAMAPPESMTLNAAGQRHPNIVCRNALKRPTKHKSVRIKGLNDNWLFSGTQAMVPGALACLTKRPGPPEI